MNLKKSIRNSLIELLCFCVIPVITILGISREYKSMKYVYNYIFFAVLLTFISFGVYLIIKNKSITGIKKYLITLIFLIIIDQICKFIIFYFDINDVNIINNFLYLKQKRNINQNGILNNFHITLPYECVLIAKASIIPLVVIIFRSQQKQFTGDNKKKFTIIGIIMLAASVCTFFDSLLWNATLDFVYFKNVLYIDIKDIYVYTACGYFILIAIDQSLENKSKNNNMSFILK